MAADAQLQQYGGELFAVLSGTTGVRYPLDGEGGITATAASSILAPTISDTGVSYDDSTFILEKTGAFAEFVMVPRAMVQITSGTNMTAGFYEVARKIDNDRIQLVDGSAGSANSSNVALSMFGVQQFCRLTGIYPNVQAAVNTVGLRQHDGTTAYGLGTGAGASTSGAFVAPSVFSSGGLLLRRGLSFLSGSSLNSFIITFRRATLGDLRGK